MLELSMPGGAPFTGRANDCGIVSVGATPRVITTVPRGRAASLLCGYSAHRGE